MILGGSSPVFGGEGQLLSSAAHVKVGVAPAVEFAGSAQGLSGPAAVGVFAGVMNQKDGQLELALEFPKVRKQARDLGGVVFIDPMKTDQRIEDQEDGTKIFHGVGEALAISWCIQAERVRGDDFYGQGLEGYARSLGDPCQSLANHSHRILGGKEQHAACPPNRELTQAGSARSDTDSDIQGQEAFATFGFPAQNADGLVGPEALDQPLHLSAGGGELAGALHGEGLGVHGFWARRRIQGIVSKAAWTSSALTWRRPAAAAISRVRWSRLLTVRGTPWSLIAQRAFVEVWRATFLTVLRWMKYWRSCSGDT